MALFPNPENVNDLMTNDINDLQDVSFLCYNRMPKAVLMNQSFRYPLVLLW